MTTELVRHQSAVPASLPEKMQYAQALAVSGMLPSQYRQQPANLLWALEFADSLGLHPMAAITGVHVIEGKPSASANLISALVRRAGHRLRVSGDHQRAICEIVRADDREYTFRVEWTADRAQQAGLLGKDIWKKYRPTMLKARSVTECARDACPEALMGMLYTPDELGADVDIDGDFMDGMPSGGAAPVMAQGWSPAPTAESESPAASGPDSDDERPDVAVAAEPPAHPVVDPKRLPKPGTAAWHTAHHPRLVDGKVVQSDVVLDGDCGICEQPEDEA